MSRLSVNINKIATLRNARGGDVPNVVNAAVAIQQFGADGITVHPRPDERHIRYQDVYDIKEVITTEFNIEGNPKEQRFIDLVLAVKPEQVTLVPDALDQLTSNHGWDTVKHQSYLTEVVSLFKSAGIRVSIFLDPDINAVKHAAKTGTDRIELYTEAYAKQFPVDPEKAIQPYLEAAIEARRLGLQLNAGHDLDLENLSYFIKTIPWIDEVSIGHALISDALYLGLETTIQRYKQAVL